MFWGSYQTFPATTPKYPCYHTLSTFKNSVPVYISLSIVTTSSNIVATFLLSGGVDIEINIWVKNHERRQVCLYEKKNQIFYSRNKKKKFVQHLINSMYAVFSEQNFFQLKFNIVQYLYIAIFSPN